MKGTYEVYPVDDAGESWSYRLRSADGKANESDMEGSRREAYEAAMSDRGDVREEHYRKDGSLVGVVEVARGPEAIVLMRPDGSVYGELSHALNSDPDNSPQVHDLKPAMSSDVAKELG